MLASIFCISGFGSIETICVKKDLSIVTICEKLITDVLSSPESVFPNRIFAGASASRKFDVITAQIIVLSALRL
jgi:hypothetical protein